MKSLVQLFVKAGKLKKLKRKGWVLRDVPHPESVADHSWRVAFMCLVLGRGRKFDLLKVLRMATLHDFAEIEAGDITPYERILKGRDRKTVMKRWYGNDFELKKIKREKEKKGIEKLLAGLPNKQREDYMGFCLEYVEGKTPEAKFAWQIDKIERLIQALEYEKQKSDFPIGPFWEEIWGIITDPKLLEFIEEIRKYFYGNKSKKYKNPRNSM